MSGNLETSLSVSLLPLGIYVAVSIRQNWELSRSVVCETQVCRVYCNLRHVVDPLSVAEVEACNSKMV